MRTITLVATCAAALVAVMVFATTAADARRGGGGARGGGHSFGGRSMARAPRMAHRAPAMRRAPVHSAQRMRNPSVGRAHQKGLHKQVAGKRNPVAQQKRNVAGGAVRNQAGRKGLGAAGAAGALGLGAAGALNAGQLPGKGVARNLPVSKAVAGSAVARGRVAVPPNVRPRLTLVNAPAAHLRPRFAPFVQRHWRRAFFWTAIAGVGYLTIPQLYYDRFYGCVSVPDPDYGCAVDLLSAAALEEENEPARVHYAMPSDAVYRYSASPAPKQKTLCSLEPFVERKWNHAFVWVQMPSIGNVTVPEDYYDRFYAYVAQDPPDYSSACKLLVEAVAADTVAASSPGTRPDLGSQPR
jgi:hypothetical protein